MLQAQVSELDQRREEAAALALHFPQMAEAAIQQCPTRLYQYTHNFLRGVCRPRSEMPALTSPPSLNPTLPGRALSQPDIPIIGS